MTIDLDFATFKRRLGNPDDNLVEFSYKVVDDANIIMPIRLVEMLMNLYRATRAPLEHDAMFQY